MMYFIDELPVNLDNQLPFVLRTPHGQQPITSSELLRAPIKSARLDFQGQSPSQVANVPHDQSFHNLDSIARDLDKSGDYDR